MARQGIECLLQKTKCTRSWGLKKWAAATVKDVKGHVIDLELSDGRRCRRHLDNTLGRREPEERLELEKEPAENNHTGTDAEKTYQVADEEQTEQKTVPSMNESAENAPLRRSTRSRQPVERYQAV